MSERRWSTVTLWAVGGLAIIAAIIVGQLLSNHATKPKKDRSHSITPSEITAGWKLVFNSTFDRGTLDSSIWRPGWFGADVTAHVNKNEPACYSSKNVTFPGDGTVHLALTATPISCLGVHEPYTGALVSTNPADGRQAGGFQFRYGLLQARIYVPGVHGKIVNWVSIMTLGQHWPEDGEDDVFETLFGFPCYSIHSSAHPIRGLYGCDRHVAPGWHTVAVDWAPGYMAWYYDDVNVGIEHMGVTSSPMYIAIVNTVSNRALTHASPAEVRVRYVRVWQPAGAQAGTDGYMYSY